MFIYTFICDTFICIFCLCYLVSCFFFNWLHMVRWGFLVHFSGSFGDLISHYIDVCFNILKSFKNLYSICSHINFFFAVNVLNLLHLYSLTVLEDACIFHYFFFYWSILFSILLYSFLSLTFYFFPFFPFGFTLFPSLKLNIYLFSSNGILLVINVVSAL